MNLTKIEIAGFKSFEQRLVVNFSAGITSIIGPNGCGKTNIVDAIRWVLGEQKTRLLRNTKMENVIFNGTRTRKPLGMAEVHLTLSNEDHALPVDYSEVTVSRKLYRDGTSEYYINGELARLKDVRGLFVDTGLGNHTYSIIEREMVDSVISEKDQDKRYLLEEAAGVMRYRIQREEALRKIEQTGGDLARVTDILAELEKEVRSLRYQMGKARRYTRLKEKLESMETVVVKRSLFELLGQIDEIRKEKAYHEGITLADGNEITVREDRLSELRIENSELERRLQDLYERRHNLSLLLQQHEERIAILNERIVANENRAAEDAEEVQRTNAKLASLDEELARYRRVIAEKEAELQNRRAQLSGVEENLKAVAAKFETAKNEVGRRKQLVLDLVKENERARGARTHIEERLADVAEKRSRVVEELESLSQNESAMRQRVEENAREMEEIKRRSSSIERSIEDAVSRIERAGSIISVCDEAVSRQTIELNRLQEKAELLRRVKSEHAQKAGEMFSGNGRVKGALADRVRIDKKYRKCFEACLSPVLQGLLTESREDAVRCVEDLRSTGNGKVQLLYPNGNGGASPAACEQPGIGTARDLIGESDGVADYLGGYLAGIVVAPDLEGAMALLARDPERRVATLDGVFFDGPGRIVVAGSDDVALTLLEFDSKLKELGEASSDCQRRLSRLRQRREGLESLRTTLGERKTVLKGELHSADEAGRRAVEQMRARELELAVLIERMKRLSTSRAEHDSEIEKLKARLDATPQPVEDSQGEGREEGSLDALERSALELEREKEGLGETAGALRLAVATVGGELATASEKCRNAEVLDGELRELVVYREEDAKRCHSEIGVARGEIAEARVKIEAAHGELDGLEKEIEEGKTLLDGARERCEEFDGEIRTLKDQRDQKRENVQKCALEIATREARVGDLVERARESFGQDVEPYLRDRSLFDTGEWENIDVESIAGLRREVDGFGPVNMLAFEEFNQKKERFDFLSKQKADLEEAKESLTQAIRRINMEARRRVNETFELVRANFKQTFVTLFDGGEADLLFTDSDDPLEARIKLVANPKGKRLQDISSLSGGERALVALSLLFAVYLVKPSPFCVFDEVDAPLDDANVSRFIRLLKSSTTRTQFIVITHNKKTMEAADYLYGVTMEEPGVSRMISVHIGEVDRFRSRRPAREAPIEAAEEDEVPVQT